LAFRLCPLRLRGQEQTLSERTTSILEFAAVEQDPDSATDPVGAAHNVLTHDRLGTPRSRIHERYDLSVQRLKIGTLVCRRARTSGRRTGCLLRAGEGLRGCLILDYTADPGTEDVGGLPSHGLLALVVLLADDSRPVR
jgi:hypothetical protein